MLTDRANAICLLEILKEYSDTNHILTMGQIISKMNIIYGIKPDRRTVYSAVALLQDIGYEISTYDENGKGYYLSSRDFEQTEIILLADAVYSFPFIPAKQSEQLIEKLQKQLSVHERKKYKNITIVRQDMKTDNRQVFWNIEQLDRAITEKKKVSFTYMEYDLDKKMHPRREKPYVVSPFGLTYINEHYYLICRYDNCADTSLYRIDKISDIKVLADMPVTEKMNKEEIVNSVYAFTGNPENITMHCNKIILHDVIDKFGGNVQLFDKDEHTFTARFTASPNGVQFWALQYLPYVEVTEPQWLRDSIIESIKSNPYKV